MKSTFFSNNRLQLTHSLNKLVILTAYHQMQRGNDAASKFEQEANFWYLTGIEAPDWRVIIDGQDNKLWLVAPDIDTIHQTFDGSLSWDDATRISGIENIVTSKQANELLIELSKKYKTVYTLGKDPYSNHYDFYQNPAGQNLRRYLKSYFSDIKDCRLELAQLRAIKKPAEIRATRKAIALTIDAFNLVKNKLLELEYEYEVEAEFSYYFKKNGASGHAYDPIVAGSKNACTLHYIDNNARLKNNSLLLIDIGARVDGYAADITRTYAIGTPTKRQIAVHEAVENAQKRIISLLLPGFSVIKYQEQVDEIMIDALVSLGLMKSRDDYTNYRKYFPHAIGHGLGIDVHDSLGKTLEFRPGMVLTVEPGIYIPEEGIGVRIEDDILITETGHENLSAALSTSL
jgi:Xaa-Pro aminopeptidase